MQIVVGVDGSKSAQSAAGWATGAAEALGAELLEVVVTDGDPPEPKAGGRRMLVLRGDPRQQLLAAAGDASAALIVVGAGHERWYPALHLGSTSHYVAHHADRPVAVVPLDRGVFNARHIVVGVDGSPGSAAASRWAGGLAHRVAGDVTALFAWQRSAGTMRNVAGGVGCAADAESACQAWTEELEVAGVLAGISVAEAEPVRALADAVASTGAGVLVLGTRGGGGFHSLQLGSVALRALQQAPTPVVLVPPARGLG